MYRWNDGIDVLQHHGILGQKWGVRRFQNPDGSYTSAGLARRKMTKDGYAKASSKEIKSYKRTTLEKLRKTAPENKKINELENKAWELASKYDFDPDDGGGGRTAKDRKAGERYMRLYDQAWQLERDRDQRIDKELTENIVKHFGNENLNSFNTREKIKTGALISAAFLAEYGFLTYIMSQDIGFKDAAKISGGVLATTAAIPIAAGIAQGIKESSAERENK